MTKRELATKIAATTQLPVDVAELAIDAFTHHVRNSVAAGKTVYLRDFGSFFPKQRSAKKAQLINAGKTITLEATTVPAFKPYDRFKNAVKNQHTPCHTDEEGAKNQPTWTSNEF